MSSSDFDPAFFLDQTTEQEATKRPPLPIGDYTAVIEKLETKQGVDPKDPTRSWVSIVATLTIDVPADSAEELGLREPVLRLKDSLFLDLTEDGKGLDWGKGKNPALRRYREATDQNVPGQAFSPRMLEGKVVKVKIGHREYLGSLLEEIKGIAKA